MRVFVESIRCLGFHGVYPEERQEGREFLVDLAVTLDAPFAFHDDLRLTLDYRQLAQIIMNHMQGPSVQLVETLGERILADCIMIPQVLNATITIRKRADGVPGNPQYVGITMERSR